MSEQLTLSIQLQDEANFQNFLVGKNDEVVTQLKNLMNSFDQGFIYLWGDRGVGKSHLLQASCHFALQQNLTSFYLPLKNYMDLSPGILEGLDQFSLVCIDNIEKIAGLREWEEALFHFYNKSILKNVRLIVAGTSLPTGLPFSLLDVQSRFSAGIIYFIKPLDDAQKINALQLRAKLRGFELSDEVGRYLLNHFPRSMSALFKGLDDLDKASLQAKHKLTIPFVKNVLGW